MWYLAKDISMVHVLKYYVSKLVMTLVLIDMGLGGPALQLWKSDG